MDSAPQTGQPTLTEVLRRLQALDARVSALELGGRSPAPTRVEAEPAERRDGPLTLGSAEWLPLTGRTFLVFGGAFVLRAVTEAGFLNAKLGVALGIAYALFWLALADRDARRGDPRSATWHGVSALAIASPLLWEATIKLGLLGAAAAAATLAGIALLALLVVWRRRLVTLAWLVTIATAITAVAGMVGTGRPLPWTASLLLLGLATLWLGYVKGVRGPMWLAAVTAFAAMTLVTLIVLVADPERRAALLDVRGVIVLQSTLLVIYVGSAIARTLARRRTLRIQEIVLGAVATGVGLGGAGLVAVSTGTGRLALGAIAAILGLAGYWAAFALADRRGDRTNFLFFSSLAPLFLLVACAELLANVALVATLAVLALATGLSGIRLSRTTLWMHGAVYALAAAAVSGLPRASVLGFVDGGATAAGAMAPTALLSLAACLLYCALPEVSGDRRWGRLAVVPRLLVLIVAAAGIAGVAVALGARLLPQGAAGEGPDGGTVAVLRTGVLSLLAVGLAALARIPRLSSAAWLVYPLLVVGGVKLLGEDLRVEETGHLVASFAFYGGALILAPRLVRPARHAPAKET